MLYAIPSSAVKMTGPAIHPGRAPDRQGGKLEGLRVRDAPAGSFYVQAGLLMTYQAVYICLL